MKKPVYIVTVMLCILLLCSCGAEFTPVKTELPTQNPTEAPTPTQSPTTAPTPTEAPTPAETVDKEAELKAEINKNITDFLNHEGEFTDEKIQEMIMWSNNYYYKKGNVELGLMSSVGNAPSQVSIQGVLLGYFEMNGDIITVMGFDGKDGNRFATFGKIETSAYQKMKKLSFAITGLNGCFEGNFNIVEDVITNDSHVILEQLEPLKGRAVTSTFSIAGPSKEVLKELAEDTPEMQSAQDAFFEEDNSKIKLDKKLASEVVSNDLPLQIKIPNGVEIYKITQIDNIGDDFEIDDSLIPIIRLLAYKAES